MNIALIGFGNMGQEIAKIAHESKEFQIVSISYQSRDKGLDINGIKKADIAIDFTSADIVLKNIQAVSQLGINLVIGTTGWYDQLEQVKSIVAKENIGLVYGQNFSVGANIFFKIIAQSAQLFSQFDYDVYGFEIHHTKKKDSPSGTAKKIEDIILKNFAKKTSVQEEKLNRQIRPEELHYASIRGGRNPGLHQVIFDSIADEVTLVHQAHGRMGFAQGALLAAQFIKGKKGMYTFDDLFSKEVKKNA